ncbi:hypothetical protein [uncultured Draconibacterium sp.]|uniref:hypothetical protein n=1 Tax=uncultured Draconibacterium sp. TaxID=1573823 RepID=UPI0029C6B934|nr:hypothetical protein [uncultured Draconibacterium sp.]
MQTLKDFLEIIYFVSGPIIAFLAFKALGQIKEAKRQVAETRESRIISSKREAYKIAADKCDYFASKIIPIINNLDKAFKENEFTFFENSIVEMTKDGYSVKPYFKDKDEIDRVFALPCLELFNRLESFSLFFTSGVAEDNIGYLTIGHTYCNTVRKYLPMIIILSDNKHFANILILYKTWNSRIEKEKLEKEKKRIDDELVKNKDFKIKSIGTE